MSKPDYYSSLGLNKSASSAEVKKAYRNLAKKYHPDRNQGDAKAETKFKEISEAYEVLKDDSKRAAYDRYGHSAFEGGGAGHGGGFGGHGADFDDISDIFGGMFKDFMGGGRSRGPDPDINKGADLRYNLDISLEEAFNGGKHLIQFRSNVSCKTCSGTGSKSGKKQTCGTCSGSGRVRMQQGFFMMERTCHACSGTGETIADPCSSCRGSGVKEESRKLTITVPAGIESGTRMRVAQEGEHGKRGGRPGDLYVFVTVKEHKLFERDGNNLYCKIPIRFTSAALGGSIEVPCIDGKKAKLSIPEGTQPNTRFRIRGKGMPVVKSGRVGDLIVETSVEVPVKLTKKQKDMLKEFDESCGNKCNPESESFFGKVKNFFDDLK